MTFNRRYALAGLAAVVASRSARAQRPSKGSVMVFGGTGLLGAAIVKLLVPQVESVGVFLRASSKTDLLGGIKFNQAVGDLFNPSDVAVAFKSAAYRSAVVALRVKDNDIKFYEKAMTAIVAGAKMGGIGHIVHHSAVGAGENAKNFANLGWEKVPNLLDRLKDQGVGEDLLKASGIPYTIIRNARIYPETEPATGKAELTEDQTVLTPMTRADLAHLTLTCLDNPKHFGKIYHVKDSSLTWPPPGRERN